MTANRERYEFIESMFEKLDTISIERIIGRYIELVPRGRHYMGLCPFHRDTKLGSFIVTPDRGIWKCFSCGDDYAGNGVKFVSLYKDLCYLEAAFETALDFGMISYDEYNKYSKKKYDSEYVKKLEKRYSEKKKNVLEPKKADPHVIHNVYQCMKDACTLSDEHKKALVEERKLQEERIKKDYFTCPVNWKQKDSIVAKIREQYPEYNDEILMTVPGFFYEKKRNKISFASYKGLCILIRDTFGQITGIQIRRDTIKEGDSRYIWFSSTFAFYKPEEYQGGCSCGSPIDVCWPQNTEKHILCITEGRFKSEKLMEKGNITVSVQGVTSWKGIPASIHSIQKQHALKNSYIFFDADILGKHVLFLQSIKMLDELRKQFPNIHFRYAMWAKKNGKGIDDCIIAGNMEHVKYFEIDETKTICNTVFQKVLQKFGVARLQDLEQKDVEAFQEELQVKTEQALQLV